MGAYKMTSRLLQDLPERDWRLRVHLVHCIQQVGLEPDFVRCYHSTDFAGAWGIIANGIRPGAAVNTHGHRNVAAGLFVTRLSPCFWISWRWLAVENAVQQLREKTGAARSIYAHAWAGVLGVTSA